MLEPGLDLGLLTVRPTPDEDVLVVRAAGKPSALGATRQRIDLATVAHPPLWLAALRAPHHDRAVITARGQVCSGGVERNQGFPVAMPDTCLLTPGRAVPEPDRSITGGRSELIAGGLRASAAARGR